jgi:hypothetical protein
MAETPKRDDTKSLADRLVSDPKNPPDLSMLQGWLGASSEEKHRRLYLDPELSQSLEIPNDAIVHTQDIPAEVNPLGGSWVWVKADAAIKQGPGLERLYARFLRGQIQQDFFAAAGGAGAGAGAGTVGAPGTNPVICPVPTIFNCPTRQTWCRPSVFTICPSQLTVCPSQQLAVCPTRPVICQVATATVQCVPSVAVQCPTRFACPSAVDACPSAPGGCWDPTIVQTTTVVQPGLGQGGFQGGFNFDPGAGAGGGFVGGPPSIPTIQCPAGPVLQHQTQFVICRPSIITICRTHQPLQCITRPVVCQIVTTTIQCVPSAAIQCPTQGFCPSAVDACPSAPGWCGDPTIVQTTTVVQPGLGQGGFQGGPNFDPGMAAGGGFVGAPVTQTPGCQVAQPTILPSQIVLCQPSVIQICHTRTPICITRTPLQCRSVLTPWCPRTLPQLDCPPWITNFPQCPPRTLAPPCPPITQPGAGCPSGFICGDPGGATTVINPGLGFDPNAGFGQAGGGFVGGAIFTRWAGCQTVGPICMSIPVMMCGGTPEM